MPKADPNHNYYADLEVSEKADTEEIKRAYRKLAKLWHPDRNPGKENDVIPRFQMIQTAQEILTDPELRSKYDNDRRKRASYGGTHGRSPSARYSNNNPFARGQPGSARNARPDFASASASNGANRFSRFPRPPPQSSAQADAEARANAYNAWQNLGARKQQHQAPPQSHPHGQAQSGPFGSRTRPTMPDEEKLRQQRTAWEQFKKAHQHKTSAGKAGAGTYQANTAKTSQKPGFDPSTPGADEPQAKNTASYFHSFPGQPPHGPSQPHYTRAPPPTAKKPENDHLKPKLNTEVPYFEGEPRLSTPYASHSGERTYFSGDAIRRSTSHRDPSHRPDLHSNAFGHPGSRPSTGPSGRARSASPKRRPSYQTQRANSSTPKSPATHYAPSANARSPTPSRGRAGAKFYMSSSEDSEERISGEANRQSNGIDPSINQRPKAQPSPAWAKNRTKSADQHSADSPLPRANDGPGMQQKSNSTMYDHDFPSSPHDWAKYWPFGSTPKPEAAASRPPPWAYPSSVRPPPYMRREQCGFDAGGMSRDAFSTKVSGLYPSTDLPLHGTSRHHRHCPSEDDWPRFESSSEYTFDPETGQMIPPREFQIKLNYLKSKLEFRSDRDADGSSKSSFDHQPNGYARASGPESRSKSSENVASGFSTSNWNGKFTGDTFSHRPAAAHAANTGAQMQNPFTSSAHDSRTTYNVPPPPPNPPPQMQAGSPFAPAPGEAKFSADKWTKEQWDSSFFHPQPQMKSTSPVRKPTTKPRAYSKSTSTRPGTIPKPATVNEAADEPTAQTNGTRPVDADGSDGSAMDIDVEEPKSASREPRIVNAPPSRSEWRNSAGTKSTSAPPTRANESNGGLNFTGFNNVAPFAPSNMGLEDLNDLQTHLPFKSAASAVPPGRTVSQPSSAQAPSFSATSPTSHMPPAPPRAPPAPAPLTSQTWRDYVAHIQAYLMEWNRFEQAIMARFGSRQATLDSLLRPGNTAWLEGAARNTKHGCDAYVQELKQDERIQEHWAVASDAHRETMNRFLHVRDRALQDGL